MGVPLLEFLSYGGWAENFILERLKE